MKPFPTLIIGLLLIGSASLAKVEVKVKDNIIIVTDKNFDKVVKDNEFVLIAFSAPWCVNCRDLDPEYVKAAKTLKDSKSKIKLGKADTTQEPELAHRQQIKFLPTLKFFRKGSIIEYTASRQAESIVNWVTRKSGPPLKELSTEKEVEEFLEKNDVAVIGFFKDPKSKGAKLLTDVALKNDGTAFGIVSKDAIISKYESQNGKIVVFKHYDEGRADYDGELDAETLSSFISTNSLPYVVELNRKTGPKLQNSAITNHLLVFVQKKDGDYEKYLEMLQEPAKKYYGQIIITIVDTDDKTYSGMADHFGIDVNNLPQMRILVRSDEGVEVYAAKLPGVTTETVEQFLGEFFANLQKKDQGENEEDPSEDQAKEFIKEVKGANFRAVTHKHEKKDLAGFFTS